MAASAEGVAQAADEAAAGVSAARCPNVLECRGTERSSLLLTVFLSPALSVKSQGGSADPHSEQQVAAFPGDQLELLPCCFAAAHRVTSHGLNTFNAATRNLNHFIMSLSKRFAQNNFNIPLL